MKKFLFPILVATCLLLTSCTSTREFEGPYPPIGGYSETNNVYLNDKVLVVRFPVEPKPHVISALEAARAVRESLTQWRIKNPDFTKKAFLDALALCNEYKATISNE